MYPTCAQTKFPSVTQFTGTDKLGSGELDREGKLLVGIQG